MPEHLLDAAQVCATLEQVGRHRMTKSVRTKGRGAPPSIAASGGRRGVPPRVDPFAALAERIAAPESPVIQLRPAPSRAEASTARTAGTPTGTVRSLLPLPSTRTTLRCRSRSSTFRPHSSGDPDSGGVQQFREQHRAQPPVPRFHELSRSLHRACAPPLPAQRVGGSTVWISVIARICRRDRVVMRPVS